MKLTKIPEEDALALLRELGLLIGQASIYGPAHNVTRNAIQAAFPALEQALRTHGTIEFSRRERALLVNGAVLNLASTTGRNLADRMILHKNEGLAFVPPADLQEFQAFIALLGAAPAALAADGGFDEALKKAGLRSVQAINVAYRRVSAAAPRAAADAEGPARPRALRRPSAAAVAHVLDEAARANEAGAETPAPPDPAAEARRQAAEARRQRAAALSDLFRQAADMLDREEGAAAGDGGTRLQEAFGRIREMLAGMSVESEKQIQTLAHQVHADRKAIAEIETAARKRGIGLQLTREELVARYAEINQELAQPLTVSGGALELLESGGAGALSEPQRELLKMAAEGIERVGRMAGYLKQISGVPDSLKPDQQILQDAYR